MSASSQVPAWIECAILVPQPWAELVAERLSVSFPCGVAFGAASLASDATPMGHEIVRVFELESGELADCERRVADELASLARDGGIGELRDCAVLARRLPREDFATSWEKRWRPFRVGRFCLVRPGSGAPPRAADVAIALEPGGAFGTGRHPTTRLCLRAIASRLRPGASVLDAGAGNGILAVAALRLGARSAVAFDNDANALPYARELAAANGALDRLDLRVGGFEVLGERDQAFDAVFANIYADLIQAHAVDLAARLAPDGWFVFSGCHVDKRAPTELAIAAAGLEVDERWTRGRWDAFVGRRRRARGSSRT